MTTQNHYTFGDSARAARRLELLAHAFAEPSRTLIERFRPHALELALDLGAGPGHTTRLLHAASRAERTLGVEASERYLAQAREEPQPGIDYVQDDITAPSGAVPPAKLVFCRFVLTHVAQPAATMQALRGYVASGGVLLLQETACMDAGHPALRRYYELVGQLQTHYGQTLYIGQDLARLAAATPFTVEHAAVRRFERPAATMAELHLQNLRTWRNDAFATRAFDAEELSELDRQLTALAEGLEHTAPVSVGLGELVLR